ncbi:cellulose synthase/poly-beta-1,6-N-acetylglucosamine synthase-like glycosyltransferase [Agromyces sp. 3263]|uniref:glycosyltransferase family 2 protein n=1 Tax=Agromyces sp. 3263 TaxID=2817750 RepID=UPI002854BB87|nr:glycosyltransferase family 2 protein [Agromyces sp. 3263]MDR6904629.1 cellulose synthase/poly-beta-1,6-N-acetylglucosamine synthase-like glycosyltransferase [Agromyces sp. 3263]
MSAETAPRVSVALGTHNGVRFLPQQLESILAQTSPVNEIVLSDDASSDNTTALARQVVAAHRAATDASTPELVVLDNSTALGVTANFEQALRAASGDLIALCDQDDVWHPDRVERALREFAARPGLDLVAAEARLVDDADEPIGSSLFETLGVDDGLRRRLASDAAFEELLKRNVLTGATMMVSRSLVERAAPFPASWVHDEWLAMVASVGGGIAVVAEPLIDYRQHGGNQIGVARLGPGGRVARLREPRTERNAKLLARAEDLAERLPSIATGDAHVESEARAKLDHELMRQAIPPRRLRRLTPVWREWRSGAYSRYGRGAQDVLRDLVQPV